MSILVVPHGWGDARTVDLQTVLDSVVCVMNDFFESDADSDIIINHNSTYGLNWSNGTGHFTERK